MSIEKIKPDDMSFDTLMTQIKNGYIKIPDFQRDFVWERTQIIDLLDSIYKHYPIGSFLFWESNDKICAYKNIGNIELKAAPEGHPINYVLDGQQRITSLFASVEEAEIKVKVNGKLKKKKLHYDVDQSCAILVQAYYESQASIRKLEWSEWQQTFVGMQVERIGKVLFDRFVSEASSKNFSMLKFITRYHKELYK